MTPVIYLYFCVVGVYVQWSTGLYGLVLSVFLYGSARDELHLVFLLRLLESLSYFLAA